MDHAKRRWHLPDERPPFLDADPSNDSAGSPTPCLRLVCRRCQGAWLAEDPRLTAALRRAAAGSGVVLGAALLSLPILCDRCASGKAARGA
jgi:hypothetical protein